MSKHLEFGTYPVRDISLSSINLSLHPNRMRELRKDGVDELAKSMKETGLINPITVWLRKGGGYRLVAGLHRLLAAKKLKWASIRCFVREDLDEDGAALIEIDENLIRAELTTEEKREHLLKRKEIWEKRHGESGKSLPTLTGRGNKGFAADTAAATGMTKRRINQIMAGPKPKRESKAEIPNTGCNYDPADEPDDTELEAVTRRRAWLYMAKEARQSAESFTSAGYRGIAAAAPAEIDDEIIEAAWSAGQAWEQACIDLEKKRASQKPADGRSEVPADDPTSQNGRARA